MDNNIIYTGEVKYNKKSTLLTIYENRITFEQLKGLFKKKYKVVDELLIEDIKVLKGKVQIKCKKKDIIINTKDETYKITCDNILEARKIEEELLKLKTGSNILERASGSVVKLSKGVIKTGTAVVGAVATAGVAVATAVKNKDEIVETIKSFKK